MTTALPKKLNLKCTNLVLTIQEPQWLKMFEVYLNKDIMKEFVTDAEIQANLKAIQKRLTPSREAPKKYHLIHEKPPQCQFFYFIRGLYFELGIGLSRPDPIKAYEIYLQGFEENQDSLCAFKIASIQSNPKNKCTVKVDKQKAMFFLVMSAILIDVQYQGNLCDIRSDMLRLIDTYEEGVKLSDILIQKFGGGYYSAEYKKIYSLMFDYQYCHPMHSLEKYTQLLNALELQIKTYGDQFSLIYLFQLLIQSNSVNNKNIKLIIDSCISAKKEAFKAALNLLYKEFQLLSKALKDHIFFFNGRQVFYEMYNFVKFFGGPDKSELFPQIFMVNELLYEKQFFILGSSLHYSLTMRNRCEMFEKGLGVEVNFAQALESINKELAMRKENESLYALANYVAAKLKRKLQSAYSEQQVNDHFQKSWNQFSSRLNNDPNPNSVSRLVYLYYLARISKLWRKDYLDTQNKFKEALTLYLRERHVYKNSKTLQFEILCIKIEKKLNAQGQASLYYGHGIQSPQSHQIVANGVAGSAPGQNQQFFGNNNNNSYVQPQNSQLQQNNNQMNQSKINGNMQQSNMAPIQNSGGMNYPISNSQQVQNMAGQGSSRINNNMNQSNNQMHQSNNQMNQSNNQMYQSNNQLQQSNPLQSSQIQPQQINFQQQQPQNIHSSSINPQVANQNLQNGLSNSAGLNGLANSNIRNNTNNMDGQVTNSQGIAQQLIGNNQSHNYQNSGSDRQNNFDYYQNDAVLINPNRSASYNQKSMSPNNHNNLQGSSNQAGFQSAANNGIDMQGLGNNPNSRNNLSNSNIVSPQANLNNNNFNSNISPNVNANIPNSMQSLGNNNNNMNFGNGSSVNHFGSSSPYGKSGHQSIFGGQTPKTRQLNSGYQNFMINRQLQEKLSMLKQKRPFIDPTEILIMDFLHRGGNYTTSEGIIINKNKANPSAMKIHLDDVNIISADKLSKLRSYKKHMNVSIEDQEMLDGEPVVIKQFIVSDINSLDEMFNQMEAQEKKILQNNQSIISNNQTPSQQSQLQVQQNQLVQTFVSQHLVYIRGFSYIPISNDAVFIYLIYPAQSYNLYAGVKKNMFSLIDKLLIACQICDCVYNLHTSSIFFLNLKPSNILFDKKKIPYFSGWEIARKQQYYNAEENIHEDDELDSVLQINYGYTPPEVFNMFTEKQQSMLSTNTNRSATPPRSLYNQQQSQFGTINMQQSKNNIINQQQQQQQFGPRSDIWSLGMILHYLFFRIDSGEGTFCRDKRVYGGFNLIITEYTIGSNYFLDKIKEIVEDMVKSAPDQRCSLSNVKDKLQKLYIELDTQIKQDHSLNKSYNSSIGTSHTAHHNSYNPYTNLSQQNQLINNNQINSFNSINNLNNINNNNSYNNPSNNYNNTNGNQYHSNVNYNNRQNGNNYYSNTGMSHSPSRHDYSPGGGYNNNNNTPLSSDPFYNNKGYGDPLGLNSNSGNYKFQDQYNSYQNQTAYNNNNQQNQMNSQYQQLGQSYTNNQASRNANSQNSNNNLSYYN